MKDDIKIKYPRGETAWIYYRNRAKEPVFVLTSKDGSIKGKVYYYLYEVLQDGSLKKLGRADTPTELETKFNIKEVLYK